MKAERISPGQFILLLFTLRSTIGMVKSDSIDQLGKPAAWISELLGFAIGLVPVWFAVQARLGMPSLHRAAWTQFLRGSLGKAAGTTAGVLLTLLAFLLSSLHLRVFSDLLTSGPMPETPPVIFACLIGLLTALTVRKGTATLARVAALVMPGAFLFQFLLMLLGIEEMEMGRLLPLLPPDPLPVIGTALTGAAITSAQILPIWHLAGHLKDLRGLPKASLRAQALAAAAVTLTSAAIIVFFGASQASVRTYPLYGLMRTINVMDFFERLDAFYLVIWTSASFITVTLLLQVALRGLEGLVGLPTEGTLALPLTALMVVVSQWIYAGLAGLEEFRSPAVNFVAYLPLTFLIPVLAFVGSRAKGRASP